MYEKDMSVVLSSMVEFLGGDEEDLPPLYCFVDHMPAAECITNFITSKVRVCRFRFVLSLGPLLKLVTID